MGIPTSAFQSGDVYIEYASEDALFRYDKKRSNDFDYALCLELKRREFVMVGESSCYRGRSAP